MLNIPSASPTNIPAAHTLTFLYRSLKFDSVVRIVCRNNGEIVEPESVQTAVPVVSSDKATSVIPSVLLASTASVLSAGQLTTEVGVFSNREYRARSTSVMKRSNSSMRNSNRWRSQRWRNVRQTPTLLPSNPAWRQNQYFSFPFSTSDYVLFCIIFPLPLLVSSWRLVSIISAIFLPIVVFFEANTLHHSLSITSFAFFPDSFCLESF